MQAIQIMSALAQPTRLEVYHLLVEALPGGMAASEIAEAVGMTRNGMSAHFAILAAARLVSSRKTGRNVIYKAETSPLKELTAFLSRAVERGREGSGGSIEWS